MQTKDKFGMSSGIFILALAFLFSPIYDLTTNAYDSNLSRMPDMWQLGISS
jgi:hypothetical protein